MTSEEILLKIIDLFLKEVSLFWTIISAFVGGVIGYMIKLMPYFVMPKKDRLDFNLTLQKEANEIIEKIDESAQEFKNSLCSFAQKNSIELEDFNIITNNANKYFSKLKICCDSILSKTISINSVENTLLPQIKETVEKKLIEEYYKTLKKCSKKYNLPYKGKFDKTNYKSIYIVYSKFIKKGIKNNIIAWLLKNLD